MDNGPSQHASSPDESLNQRISWLQLIAYGLGGVVPIALFNIAGQLIQLLGNISLGLSSLALGAILMVPRLWDAVSDPVVGYLSDNTRTRWGRRRPYILVGGLMVAGSFVAMWWVPRSAGDAEQLAFILVGVIVFYTACTLFEIPHGALGLEMSGDYHERTRLFSAKSFFGNLFAMGTPWLIALATLPIFAGPGGDLVDGMRYVSLSIAIFLVPMAWWWFVTLREPGFAVARNQRQTSFWSDMRAALANATFLRLVIIIFTLAMGFNFVGIFNYYITIFYLYGGSEADAAGLLGVNGTLWAITGLLAVFPLNWISRRIGKNSTLLLAILLMAAAQLAKIVCYDPAHPYLVLIPTVLLSAGMLMFFTLGSSMVGDVCDEDELHTGTRSEGSYYSVYWWFIKMGAALASLVMGLLLMLTSFDESQNKLAGGLRSPLEVLRSDLESAQEDVKADLDTEQIAEQLAAAQDNGALLRQHWIDHKATAPDQRDRRERLLGQLAAWERQVADLAQRLADQSTAPADLQADVERLLVSATALKQQSPRTLLLLRVVEIGLPLVMSVVSMLLTLRYPLTEARCHEINEQLRQRRGGTQPS